MMMVKSFYILTFCIFGYVLSDGFSSGYNFMPPPINFPLPRNYDPNAKISYPHYQGSPVNFQPSDLVYHYSRPVQPPIHGPGYGDPCAQPLYRPYYCQTGYPTLPGARETNSGRNPPNSSGSTTSGGSGIIINSGPSVQRTNDIDFPELPASPASGRRPAFPGPNPQINNGLRPSDNLNENTINSGFLPQPRLTNQPPTLFYNDTSNTNGNNGRPMMIGIMDQNGAQRMVPCSARILPNGDLVIVIPRSQIDGFLPHLPLRPYLSAPYPISNLQHQKFVSG